MIVTMGGPTIVSTNAWVAGPDKTSVSFTVKLTVPLFVGVAELTPLVARVNPRGQCA